MLRSIELLVQSDHSSDLITRPIGPLKSDHSIFNQTTHSSNRTTHPIGPLIQSDHSSNRTTHPTRPLVQPSVLTPPSVTTHSSNRYHSLVQPLPVTRPTVTSHSSNRYHSLVQSDNSIQLNSTLSNPITGRCSRTHATGRGGATLAGPTRGSVVPRPIAALGAPAEGPSSLQCPQPVHRSQEGKQL